MISEPIKRLYELVLIHGWRIVGCTHTDSGRVMISLRPRLLPYWKEVIVLTPRR